MTTYELYRKIVGEGGMSPSDFFGMEHWWEVRAAYEGTQARCHTAYENSRLLAWHILTMFGSDDTRARLRRPEDMYRFVWERGEEDLDIVALKRLIEETRELNEKGDSERMGLSVGD